MDKPPARSYCVKKPDKPTVICLRFQSNKFGCVKSGVCTSVFWSLQMEAARVRKTRNCCCNPQGRLTISRFARMARGRESLKFESGLCWERPCLSMHFCCKCSETGTTLLLNSPSCCCSVVVVVRHQLKICCTTNKNCCCGRLLLLLLEQHNV